MQVAYRRSPAFEAAPESVTAWPRQGELLAEELECAPFDKAELRSVLGKARRRTQEPFPAVRERLVELCATAGVAVVFVPELPKTHRSGIARRLSKDKALIQLSFRYKRSDHLWFTFFHEAGHILLHGTKTLFIDEQGGPESELEQEANGFASELLIPAIDFARFSASGAPPDRKRPRALLRAGRGGR